MFDRASRLLRTRATAPPLGRPTSADAMHLYRDIVENAVWGIFQTTPDGRYLAANPALARIYGYDSPAAMLAALTDIGGQLYVDPRQRDRFVQQMQAHGTVANFEAQVRRRDGSVIWISESCREVRNAAGALLYYEGTVSDITERKQAEEALRDAKLAAERADRAKSVFLAGMSHELRTPLNAIIGFAELIVADASVADGNPHHAEYAAAIADGGRRLASILGDILEYARADAGTLRLARERLDLAFIVRDAILSRQPRADAAGVDIRMIGDGAPSEVDGERLMYVLCELLDNAMSATAAGGLVEVALATQPDGMVVLTVRDDGAGFGDVDPIDLLRPFQHVQDIDVAQPDTGGKLGLGLATCERIVHLHGGRLTIASAAGSGTVVTVTLPAA